MEELKEKLINLSNEMQNAKLDLRHEELEKKRFIKYIEIDNISNRNFYTSLINDLSKNIEKFKNRIKSIEEEISNTKNEIDFLFKQER